MSKYQKQIDLLFIAAGFVVFLLVNHYWEILSISLGLARKLGGAADAIQIGLPIIAAVGTFFALRTNVRSYNFVADAVHELALVSWPSQKETRLGTIVVIITVVLAGLFLGLLDLGFMSIVKTIINL